MFKSSFCETRGCLNIRGNDSTFCKKHDSRVILKEKRPKIRKNDIQSMRIYRQYLLQEALITGKLHGRSIVEVIFERYKKGAEKREIIFNITIDDFKSLWNKPCEYCGDVIQTIGVDRVDNNLGYEIGNLVACCTQCNLSKRNLTAEDYITRSIKIATKYFMNNIEYGKNK